jgi:hypothetical protein
MYHTLCTHNFVADRLIRAYSPLIPAIMRAASVHILTQSDHIMLFFFLKSSTFLNSSFAVAPFIGL